MNGAQRGRRRRHSASRDGVAESLGLRGVVAVVAAILIIGCGDTDGGSGGDGGATDTSPVTETPKGPSGELLANGVGTVKQGTPLEEALELLGPPDQKDRFPGCELNPESSATIQLRYDLADGSVSFHFAATDNEMVSYRSTSSSLPTTLGDRVGDSFRSLQANWGTSLMALDLGVASTSKAGYWFVQDSKRAEILFDVRGGKVKSISGGYLPPCE